MYTGFEPSDNVNVDPSASTSEKSGAAGPSTPDGFWTAAESTDGVGVLSPEAVVSLVETDAEAP